MDFNLDLEVGELVTVRKCSFFKKNRKTLKGTIKSIIKKDDIDIVGEWTDYEITIELEDGQTILIEITTAYTVFFPKYKILKNVKQ